MTVLQIIFAVNSLKKVTKQLRDQHLMSEIFGFGTKGAGVCWYLLDYVYDFSGMNNICFYNKKVVLRNLNLIKSNNKNGRSQ